ncbi:MrcB family domain-containing protein [Marinifilum sp. RC60d5]|uniref:MrcB family domain-containing protein n=1 Tax=Marinifilum sp. RC60d5 TaxID=3458414 RepID=UPI0040351862
MTQDQKKFSWVQTHKELVEYLVDKENDQEGLIEILKKVGITPLNDENVKGEKTDLLEIDPFTFFCYIYKYGPDKRLSYLQKIAKYLDVSIPLGEAGIPSANAQSVWLFPYKHIRTNNEIQRLWALFFAAINDQISDELFDDVLNIKNVAKTKLTEALFNVNPERYLPINGPTKPYIEEVLGINPNFNTYTEYIRLLNKIKTKVSIPFYELSYRAWEWNQNNSKQKMNDHLKYSEQLIAFLEQAETDNLKTKHFKSDYNGLKVKVSFGQGAKAQIPWISFLGKDQKTSEGIYPVYLYIKEANTLVLAYGVSEENKPNLLWPSEARSIPILNFFIKNKLPIPKRYLNSFVFKTYDLDKELIPDTINDDLNTIISFYKSVIQKTNNKITHKKNNVVAFSFKSFKEVSVAAGLMFSDKLISRYVSSLCTKPFVLLSGLSGSGKTKLAQSFAQWICENKEQYCIVPVGADWTNREPLLGYPNALDSNNYVKPENGVLDLLLNAKKHPNKPFFLILDEMNLSHVERYFADFLSAMESDDSIPLHPDKEGKRDNEGKIIPHEIKLPKNLFIVGTVNIDETTYMFSPKVLDRANAIEFRIDTDDITAYLKAPQKINLEKLEGAGAVMAESFVKLSQKEFDVKPNEELNKELIRFFTELKKSGAEFGYRTAGEIHRLFNQLSSETYNLEQKEIIDIAIMQKLLPKVHGSRRKLEDVLHVLASFCVQEGADVEKYLDPKSDLKFNEEVKYPLSLEKICRMYKGAIDNGFASYAEA